MRGPSSPRPWLRVLGVMLAVLALTGRLVTGSVVVDARAWGDVAALAEASVGCVADANGRSHGPDRPGEPAVAAAVLTLAALADPAPLPVAAVPSPARRQAALRLRSAAAVVYGPPAASAGGAWPRGPPTLS